MRRKIVAGNWKMHKNAEETEDLLNALIAAVPTDTAVRVIVAPSFINLASAADHLAFTHLEVAAQNMHEAESGAYTGEISANMLTSIGVQMVILGHSERRSYFNETDQVLALKINSALQHQMEVIYCFGEELEHRQQGLENSIVEGQLKQALFHLEKVAWKNITLAYEPVWAIGTGETATPAQAQAMHAFVRQTIRAQYGQLAEEVTILYGGSVKPENALEIFSKPDVDGGLIGGASLDANQFAAIVSAADHATLKEH